MLLKYTGFLVGATAEQQKTALKLTWKSDKPIWTEQWSLSHEKLQALEQLVEEQLSLNHIASTTSPWNSPVFVIKKKSGKWRMLTDLRKIYAIIEPMGTLQPDSVTLYDTTKLENKNH